MARLTPLLLGTLLLVAVVALGSLAVIYHKIRRIHLMLYAMEDRTAERIDNLYSQLEALLALYHDLEPAASLPVTRGWAASPDFLRHIHRHAREHHPASIVECSSGTSTVVLARAVQANGTGHVFSLEHEPQYASRTRDELRREGLESFATVIDAPLRSHQLGDETWQWYEIDAVPTTIDMLVVDGPPGSIQFRARYPAIPILRGRITPGAAVFLDDADRQDEKGIVTAWLADAEFERAGSLKAEKGIAWLRKVSTRSSIPSATASPRPSSAPPRNPRPSPA